MYYSKGYDNFISTSSDPATTVDIASFLNDFNQYLNVYLHKMDIEEQIKLISIKDGDLKKAIEKSEDYQKNFSDLQNELIDNDKQVEMLKKQLVNENSRLSEMKG